MHLIAEGVLKVTRFGLQVDKLQAERGMSNKDLARRLGVTPSRVSQLKNTSKPHPMTIKKLSEVFEVDVAFFFVCC